MSGVQSTNPYAQFVQPQGTLSDNPYAGFVAPSAIAPGAHPMAPPAPAALAPGTHPMAGPSGDLGTDAARNLGTMGIAAVSGIASAPNMLAQGIDWAGRHTVGDPGLSTMPGPFGLTGDKPMLPTASQVSNGLYDATGATQYMPQTTLGKYAQAAGPMVMTALLGGGLRAGAAALGGDTAAAGQALQQTAGQLPAAAAAGIGGQFGASLTPDNPAIGGIVGGILGGHGFNTAIGGAANAVHPAGGSLPMEDAQLAQQANDLGIPLSLSQVSRSPGVKIAADIAAKVPFSGGQQFLEDQRSAWQSALAQQMGETATKITPDVLNAARTRIGGVFDGVAQRTTIPFQAMIPDIQQVVNTAKLTLPADAQMTLSNNIMNIAKTATGNGGNIGGQAYLNLTAKGGALDTLMQSADPSLRQVGGQLRDMLDDHLAQNAAPGDMDALGQARAQWKAYKTIQPLTLRADTTGGATPSTGDISPAALRGAVNQNYGVNSASLGNAGNMDTLARIGQRFIKPSPTTGTAENAAAEHALGGLGGLAAAVIGMREVGVPEMAAAPAALGTMAATRYAINPILQNQFLARQSVAGSLNPNGFRFGSLPMGQQLPLSMSPMVPQQQQ